MASSLPTIIIACGGTGGHVYPGIALAQGMPGYSFVFVGSKTRQDSRIVPKYGYPFFSISAAPRNILKLVYGFFQSVILLRKLRPIMVIGTGSYHTIGVVVAAKLLGVPIILLEQNAIPGRVNRLLSKCAKKVCVSFEESKRFFRSENVKVTGNPIRRIFAEDTVSFDAIWDEIGEKPIALVFGGSQGADALNKVAESLYMRSDGGGDFVFIHITGRSFYEKRYANQAYEIIRDRGSEVSALVVPYAENMGLFYQKSTVVVARSGATTVAELLHFKKTAILVPYPHATDDHQTANAEAFCREGAGMILSESDLSPNRLLLDISQAITLPFPERKVQDAVRCVQLQIEDIIKGD